MSASQIKTFTLNVDKTDINVNNFVSFLLSLNGEKISIDDVIHPRKSKETLQENKIYSNIMVKSIDNYIFCCIQQPLKLKRQLEILDDDEGIIGKDASKSIILIPFIVDKLTGNGAYTQYFHSLTFNDFKSFITKLFKTKTSETLNEMSLISIFVSREKLFDYINNSLKKIDAAYFKPDEENNRYSKIKDIKFNGKNHEIKWIEKISLNIHGANDINIFLQELEKHGLLKSMVKLHGKSNDNSSKTLNYKEDEEIPNTFTLFDDESLINQIESFCLGKNMSGIRSEFNQLDFFTTLKLEINKNFG